MTITATQETPMSSTDADERADLLAELAQARHWLVFPTRDLTACDEYTAVRWVGDPIPVECPLNVRQLVRLALAAES